MELINNFFSLGLVTAVKPFNLFLMAIGVFGGLIFGAIPGLSATMAITLVLPFTFFMDPISSLILLTAIYVGGISGGCIGSTLLNMPGTPSSIATTFDAYPMAQKGKAGLALGLGIFSSAIGGIASGVVLAVAAPFLAWQALKLGPFEFFSLGMFTYLAVCGMLGGDLSKNLIGIAVGLILASVGTDPVTGVPRLTFGFDILQNGVSLLPLLVGLFCISQVIEMAGQKKDLILPKEAKNVKIRELFPQVSILTRNISNYIRSFLIGLFTGILPGIGGATSNIIAYGVAKSNSKHPDEFGKGCPDGIIASEVANNGSVGGAMVPLLALGIPGDAVTAMLLGAFVIHGLQASPLLFQSHPKLVYSIFAANIASNVIMLLMGLFLIKFFIRMLSFPKRFILPIIVVCCVLGAYAANNQIFDVIVLMIFGIFGYLWKKMGFPLVPIVVAYVLEPIVETGIRQGLTSSGGSFLPLITRPISLALLVGGVLMLSFGIFLQKYLKRRTAPK